MKKTEISFEVNGMWGDETPEDEYDACMTEARVAVQSLVELLRAKYPTFEIDLIW